MDYAIDIGALVKQYDGSGSPVRRSGRRPAGRNPAATQRVDASTRHLAGAPPRVRALDGLDLQVQRGEIFGFLGPNGAGKTTTIRILLDLIRPTSGSVRVLGRDPREAGPALRRHVGYLPGDVRIGVRQSSRDLLTHLGHLRGGVAPNRIEALAERLELDLDAPVRSLSKGNRQKVGLVQAFMHEPELLILDEPTSGLDPLFQREFLTMVREAARGGRTVFMSSHVLSEVEQVADRVGVIRAGRLAAVDSVEALRERAVRRVEIVFAEAPPASAFADVDGLDDATLDGARLSARLVGRADALVKAAARFEVVSILAAEPDLEALFFSHYERSDRDAA
jgi:ABC-2 type transport system ATP-binding protein